MIEIYNIVLTESLFIFSSYLKYLTSNLW